MNNALYAMDHSPRNQKDLEDLGDVLTQAEIDAIKADVQAKAAASLAAWQAKKSTEKKLTGDELAAYFCDTDPRTPEQRGQDEDAADYAATIAGL